MKFLNVGSSNSTRMSMSLVFVSSPLTKEPKRPILRTANLLLISCSWLLRISIAFNTAPHRSLSCSRMIETIQIRGLVPWDLMGLQTFYSDSPSTSLDTFQAFAPTAIPGHPLGQLAQPSLYRGALQAVQALPIPNSLGTSYDTDHLPLALISFICLLPGTQACLALRAPHRSAGCRRPTRSAPEECAKAGASLTKSPGYSSW